MRTSTGSSTFAISTVHDTWRAKGTSRRSWPVMSEQNVPLPLQLSYTCQVWLVVSVLLRQVHGIITREVHRAMAAAWAMSNQRRLLSKGGECGSVRRVPP